MTIDPDEVEQVREYLLKKQRAHDQLMAGTVDASVLAAVEKPRSGLIKMIVPRYPGVFGSDG